jgi:hypothetical protein
MIFNHIAINMGMVLHRDPPKPEDWDKPEKGKCRFCALAILNDDGTVNRRTQWHPICVVDYQMIYWPGTTRKAVWMRDEGKCAVCGHRCAQRGTDVWHLDHVKPLIEAQGDISYWQMGNLQTLCQPCHHAKTGREATERAEARRQVKAGVELDPGLFELPVKTPEIQERIRDRLAPRILKKRPPRRRRR